MRPLFQTIVLWCILVGQAVGQPGSNVTPKQTAQAIVDRVIRETSFELRPVQLKPTLDIQVIDFRSMFGTSRGIAYALSAIKVEKDTTLSFGISRDFPLLIKLNDATIYRDTSRVPFIFMEIGYELFRFNDSLRLPLKKGVNTILVKAQLSGDRDVVYLRELNRPGVKLNAQFDLGAIDSSMMGKAWMFTGLFESSSTDVAAVPLPPESGYKKAYSYQGSDFVWRIPEPQMVQELRIKSDAAYRRESYAEWQYPTGTVMLSMLEYADATKDTAAGSFVRRYCSFTVDNLELFRNQYERLHAFRGTNHKLIRQGMLDDTGAPGLPFIELLVRTHDPRIEPTVLDVARYVMNGQMRLSDGTLCRYERIPGTVWADDLFMSTPYMMRMGILTGEQRYFDDAARQVVNFNKYLLDKQTGLYRHGWYDLEKRQAPVAWGRANGWVIWATSEVLRFLPSSHPLRPKIVDIYRSHIKALVAVQATTGLWHQVLDRPESYEETSCTAMFIIGLARGLRQGILDESYAQPLKKAWQGLQTRISADGIVKDICRGTEMSDDVTFYMKRERFDNDPRGLGAVILACVEIMKFQGGDTQK
jgi:unsaturated rhamnogalacturonyl hydrolase